MKNIIRIHLFVVLIFFYLPNSSLANEEWISMEEENKLEGIRIICSIRQNSLWIKEIKTLIESSILNKETQYLDNGGNLYINHRDTIKILPLKNNKELFISHHKYGDLRLVPFKRYHQSKNITEIKDLLLSNIIKINYNNKEFYFDINRDSICVDTSMSFYGQLYYIELFDEEVFLILTRMFGPILHIKKYNQNEIIAYMYNGKTPHQINLQLQMESNDSFRNKLDGQWVSKESQSDIINLDCSIKNDTILFSNNECHFNNFCYKSKALWDVCHNGRFITLREFDHNYNEYKMPEKLRFQIVNNTILKMEVPFKRGRIIGKEWKTFTKLNND